MDFLPEDLAENLIPYEPEPMQTGVLPELPPEVQIQSGVMPELPPEVQYQTGVLPELPPEVQYQTGVLPELPPEVQYQTGVMPELPPEVQIQSGVIPELPPEVQVQMGVLPEQPLEEQYQSEAIPQVSAEPKLRKKKRSKDNTRQPVEITKRKKEHRKSPDIEANEEKTEVAITSSYVEKKSSPFKDRFKYTVIVVPENRRGHFRPVFLGYTLVNVILGFLAVLLVILAVNNVIKGFKIRSLTAENEKMQSTIETMETNMVYLTSANAGLSDKVAVLSETVNQKTGELENYVKDEESKMTPKGFPFAGQAALLESTETSVDAKVTLGGESESEKNKKRKPGFDLEGYPIAIFSASKGTNVIATANGKVKEVADDLCFGKRVTVEHSNGMLTIYRCSATPKVNVKQEIKQGDTLYELGSDNVKLGYQIIKGNDYIDPLEMLDIAG